MTGLLRAIVRNWPLKLGAVVLAALLYGGLVLSEQSRVFEGSVPVDGLDQSADVVLLSDLGVVRRIRYFASSDLDVPLDASSFRATVDLGDADPSAGTISLAIRVDAVDPRVQILDFEPRNVVVTLDEVVTRVVPIEVDRGVVPPGLDVREAVLSTTEAVVRGPASVVRRIVAAVARVRIEPSGLDINRDVELVAVDALDVPLTPVDVAPETVRVRIAVFTDRQTRTLPVNPVVVGTPAVGWEVASIVVEPSVVTVEGDADELEPLVRLDTEAASIAGASGDVRLTLGFDLPTGVLPLGSDRVTVTVTLRQLSGTRTFEAGLALIGARSDRTYEFATDRVLATFGGVLADLDRVSPTTLVATIDVTGLAPGTYELPVTMALPAGLGLVALAPDRVTISIGQIAPTPLPSPSP